MAPLKQGGGAAARAPRLAGAGRRRSSEAGGEKERRKWWRVAAPMRREGEIEIGELGGRVVLKLGFWKLMEVSKNAIKCVCLERRTGGGGAGGGTSGTMLQFYTDDAPGLKISPNVVLVMSIGFIAFVAVLHVVGKLYLVRKD
ncbi:hypothetical protein SASPL_106108 [Salvia splendens]|uniref:Protein transport protein Sec61 subunit beta n=1 Tax=Salvia splendens TaxID=180675 RepID=A0A8X9ABE5_SALSN|nr:hypothetical protein SASPL_106108 [Salvia splendens]